VLFRSDSSQKSVRSNFHTTLYRARQALGENVIVFRDGLYQVTDEIDLWCDAHELDDLTVQARLLPPRDARTEDLWRRAARLYQGDFLLSVDMDWVLPRREALREAYLEALLGIGECARARNDLREALAVFKHALDIDPYREDVHRIIMTCYAEQGEKRLILAHFRRLQDLLREELAVEPSQETVDLARSLLT
jgi:LuxR family transcriptional regulator, maltose regulon positive regulatory protein